MSEKPTNEKAITWKVYMISLIYKYLSSKFQKRL